VERIPEPELMDDLQQAIAYDQADFSKSHSKRVALFQERYLLPITGNVLDLGCGSGDILERFANAMPHAKFIAVDGAAPMLELAKKRFDKSPQIAKRIQFVHAFLPSAHIPALDYQIVMSNSMLHHLHQPQVLWETIRQHAQPSSFVFVGDLRRPESEVHAAELIDQLAADEPEILRRDFYNSLCAAFTAEEVREQLTACGVASLTVEEVGEIHMLVYGKA
jgi:ubiquinone/menaquinone biosynthesis C-methylase UbiE